MLIGICDDEKEVRMFLGKKVKSVCPEAEIRYYQSGKDLLREEDPVDILLLDIHMPGQSGMETAETFRETNKNTVIIFVTALEEYVYQAFDVGAFHYLVKPVDIKKLETILWQLCSSLTGEYEHTLAIRQGTAVIRIPFGQILYLEAMNRKIHLHKNGEFLPYYGKLDELEPTLPDTFFRCHRSYIVNFDHVQHYKKEEIWLDNEVVLPLSRRRYQAFGLAFMYYLKNRGDVF